MSRAIRIYLLAIVAPALVLLYLGLKSAQRLHGNCVSSPDLHISLMIARTDGA